MAAGRFHIPNFDFYRRLSPRERVLVAAGRRGGVRAGKHRRALAPARRRSARAAACTPKSRRTLRLQKIFAQEQPMWAQRMAWLKTRQPAVVDRARAGPQLLELVQGVARVLRASSSPTRRSSPRPRTPAGRSPGRARLPGRVRGGGHRERLGRAGPFHPEAPARQKPSSCSTWPRCAATPATPPA